MADNNTEKQRVQELTNKLEQGLQDLFNSDSYRNYLSTMSKFHNYSFNNTLLIAMQKPEATLWQVIRRGRRTLSGTSIKEKRQSVFLHQLLIKSKRNVIS